MTKKLILKVAEELEDANKTYVIWGHSFLESRGIEPIGWCNRVFRLEGNDAVYYDNTDWSDKASVPQGSIVGTVVHDQIDGHGPLVRVITLADGYSIDNVEVISEIPKWHKVEKAVIRIPYI